MKGIEPDDLIGNAVKLEFPVSKGQIKSEWMWVRVTGIANGMFVGTLGNEPVFADMAFGQSVSFRFSDIADFQRL
jgi:uncharacterized protein YegJ (DUF2314 family)